MSDFAEPRKVLLAQARTLKMEVDGRWSTDTLAEKVLEAQEAHEQNEAQAILDASDTWVYAIRDCFLGTEKKPATSVFMAPKQLYNNWKPAGACRLADEDEIEKAKEG